MNSCELKQSPIETGIGNLIKEAEDLSCTVSNLIVRLEPILATPMPQKKIEEPFGAGQETSLQKISIKLEAIRMKFQNSRKELSTIFDRLEI